MLNPKQLWQVCRFEVLRRLRSPSGLIALLVLVIASGVVGRQLAGAAKLLNQASSDAMPLRSRWWETSSLG